MKVSTREERPEGPRVGWGGADGPWALARRFRPALRSALPRRSGVLADHRPPDATAHVPAAGALSDAGCVSDVPAHALLESKRLILSGRGGLLCWAWRGFLSGQLKSHSRRAHTVTLGGGHTVQRPEAALQNWAPGTPVILANQRHPVRLTTKKNIY